MKLLRKRVRNSDKTYAVMYTSQSELEILQAIVTKAELHTPKILDTEKALNKLKSMRIALGRALGQWSELPIVDEVIPNNIQINIIDIQKIMDIIETKLEEQEKVKNLERYYAGCEYNTGLSAGKLQTLRVVLNDVKEVIRNSANASDISKSCETCKFECCTLWNLVSINHPDLLPNKFYCSIYEKETE